MRRLAALVLIPLFFTIVPPASGQIYQYQDRHGNIVFTDKPPQGSNARERRANDDTINWSSRGESDYPSPETGAAAPSASTREEKRKPDYSRVTVVMYMTDWCGYCKKAREYVQSLGAGLVEHNIEKEPGKKEEMQKKSGGSTGVPLLDIEGAIIRGYSPPAIKAALDKSVQ